MNANAKECMQTVGILNGKHYKTMDWTYFRIFYQFHYHTDPAATIFLLHTMIFILS